MQQAVVGRAPPSGRGAAPLVLLLGWLCVALVNATTVAIRLRGSTFGLLVAAVLHVIGHAVALGLVGVGATVAWRRLQRAGRARWLAALGLGWLFAWAVLGRDLVGLRRVLPGWVHFWLIALLLALGGTLLIWLAVRVAARLPRRRWPGFVLLVGGGALAVANAGNLPLSYQGLHLLGLLTSGWIAQAGVAWLAGDRSPDPRLQRLLLTVAATGAAISLLRAPSNGELILLLREPGAALAPYLAELRPALPTKQRIPEGQRPWFADRSSLPPIPPSSPPLVPQPVVVMLGIDSLRADVLADPRWQAALPELFRLRGESTYFSNARSAGTSTVPSLAAIFSGLYFSQQYWKFKEARDDVYAHEDPSPRFPELLSAAGVTTISFDAVGFFRNEYGVARGFREETVLRTGRAYASGQSLMDAAIARLEQRPTGPLFLFLHLVDAHSPYTRAGKKATPFEGYIAELGLIDHQLGRLRQALERLHLADRAILIVLSDHGEAFGEHGTNWHGHGLYDELLRVPLMIWTRSGPPRTLGDPVSLIDLGPTVLDLMGVATPARYMGESLVPYLRGERPTLTRPIVAEARLKRSLLTPEGVKIIHDTQAQTVEIFDLRRDPREENNLFGTGGDELLGVLRAFFQVHTFRRPGYEVPYRRW